MAANMIGDIVMPESAGSFIEDYHHLERWKERAERILHDNFMDAIHRGDSALIEKYLKNKEIQINRNGGEALKTLLDKGDYFNAAKLLDADALTKFTIRPPKKGLMEIDLLADRQLTKSMVYLLADTKQQNSPKPY